MTRVYDEAGTITPVTVILAEPNAVLQVKTVENDGYAAVQVGVFDQKEHRVTKPELGHFKKAGCDAEEVSCANSPRNGEETQAGRRAHRHRLQGRPVSSTSSASPRAKVSRAR